MYKTCHVVSMSDRNGGDHNGEKDSLLVFDTSPKSGPTFQSVMLPPYRS